MKPKKSSFSDNYCLDEKEWFSPKTNKKQQNKTKDNNYLNDKAQLTTTAPGVYFLNFK